MTAREVRILLVEDDPNDVLLFRRALGRLVPDARLDNAQDGDEAVRLLAGEGSLSERDRATHVVLDLKLPKRSGLEVLEWIRGHPSLAALPVIVLTSSKDPSDLERVRMSGADLYCVKAANYPDLVETVRQILKTWRLLA